MLLPFDMLAAILFLGHYLESPPGAPPGLPASLAIVAALTAGVAAVSALVTAAAIRFMDRSGNTVLSRRRAGAIADGALRGLLAGGYAALLECSAFPWSVARSLGFPTRGESAWVQIAGLAPFVLLFFAVWLPSFRLHRRITPGIWTRSSHIVHKARYNLYMLLAWIPFALLADWLGDFFPLVGLFLGLAACFFPVLLVLAWGCKHMPEGEVLEAVRRLERKTGARFSRVYLWEPGGGTIQNAAAVGIVHPFRFLFLTPALIRGMSGPELDAVILHELGHVKKRHLLFYLFTSLAGVNAAFVLGYFATTGETERFLVTVALVLLYFRFVFGWLSRAMERQADLFALEHSGPARSLANALEKLGLAAGNTRLAASWHHLGIAERVDCLRQAEREPGIVRSHNSHVRRIMVTGYLFSLLFLGFMSVAVYTDWAGPRSALPVRAEDPALHWRRIMRLLPEDPRGPLELAYFLAREPGRREEAAALARQALSLPASRETREDAAKLLRDLDREGAGRP